MSQVETESLILKTYNLAEADKIVLLLTREHGVVRGVAKGAKRLKSKFGSSLEPFSSVRVSYLEKESRELVSIERIELLLSRFEAASDPEFLAKFSYLVELLVAFSPPHDPNEALYRMVAACLDGAASRSERLPAIGLYFEIWLLRLSGLLPDWSRCAECGKELGDGGPASLKADFELVCGTCRRSGGSTRIEAGHREIFGSSRRLGPGEFADRYALREVEIRDVSNVMRRIASRALGRDIAEVGPAAARA
ncbi:MAG: DNA repair protein RecO [Pyrinomonadaceae bacterium]